MSRFGNSTGGFGFLPPFIKFLLLTNIAVFMIDFIISAFTLGGISLGQWFTGIFALYPMETLFVDTQFSFWPWQLVTYQFMHGGLWHLFFNMFALWMFGKELEEIWGSNRFAAYYLMCGVGAGLVQFFSASLPTVGASGSVFGILLAYGMTFPDRKILMFPLFIPIPAKIYVGIFMMIEIFSGISNQNSGIAHFAHAGGALVGFLLLKDTKLGLVNYVSKWFKFGGQNESYYQSWHTGTTASTGSKFGNFSFRRTTPTPPSTYAPPQAKPKVFNINGESVGQDKIDEILDKISRSGYANLSENEKNILNELSKRI